MKLGVIGGGVVGRATARAFVEHVEEVRVWDVLPGRATHGLHPTLQCDLVFVCLPEDALDEFFGSLNPGATNFVVKSTVPVGTTRKLKERFPHFAFVHSPEFLTGRCANTDAQMPARNIIGVADWQEEKRLTLTGKDSAGGVLINLLERRFPGVQLLTMSSDESEAVKLVTNSLFAVKLAYLNEAHAFCTARGLCWERVLAGILSDGRIAHAHTKVPGPDGRFGFGGCLAKDLDILVDQIIEAGMDAWVTGAAAERNEKDRKRVPLTIDFGDKRIEL